MKKTVYIIQWLSVMLLMGACTGEGLDATFSPDATEGRGVSFELNLSSGEPLSRADRYTEDGVPSNNENKISKADVFFYANATDNAIYKLSYDNINEINGSATLSGTIPTNIVEQFTNGTCYAYAVVNGPETPNVATDTDTKITTLKQIQIAFDDDKLSGFPYGDFVMDGEATLTQAGNKIGGTINLDRAASKIQLFTSLNDFTDDAGNVWHPQATGMAVSFINGVKASHVNVVPNDRAADNYFNLSDRSMSVEDNNVTYTHDPFYSYSSDWGRESNPDNEAYLTLRIYWKKNNEKQTTPYYYRVPINLEAYTDSETNTTYPAKCLECNTYYRMLLEVGVLGDLKENSQVTLTPKYKVMDWKTEGLDVTLKDYHYLVVDKNKVDVCNKTSVSIGYEACDDVTVKIKSISVPDFSTNTIGPITYAISDSDSDASSFTVAKGVTGTSDVSSSSSALKSLLRQCKVSLDKDNKLITLEHELQNDNSTTPYDYAIYTIVIEVTTSCGLTETITVRQYPARYIEGTEDVNKYSTSNGTVWINGYSGYSDNGGTGKGSSWYYVNNTLSGSTGHNSNPNMYVITITSFDKTQTGFILTDPRETEIDNLATSGWKSAPAMYGTTPRTLTYYYPTKTDNANYIAPKFRTAAAYGRLSGGSVTAITVKQRCAAYQEDGYPAGRWRLPTAAELQYLGKLCVDGVIPALFNNGIGYYSATETYVYNSTSGTFTAGSGQNNSVRCVYDEWYWQNKCDEYTFTWGDQPR